MKQDVLPEQKKELKWSGALFGAESRLLSLIGSEFWR